MNTIIDLMQLIPSPHVAERKTDSGQKSVHYAAILSGKNDSSLWSLSTVEQFASSFLTNAGSDFTFTPRMQKISQDLMITEANKLTCMPR